MHDKEEEVLEVVGADATAGEGAVCGRETAAWERRM